MSRLTLTFGIAVALLAIASAAEELYSDKYDTIDIIAILNNEEQRIKYYKCFDDSEPCPTPAAQFFKDHLAEAFLTKCRKCTEKQKEYFSSFNAWYTKNSPKEWEDLVAKWEENAKKPSRK